MTMNQEDIIRRMSSEQIATALQRLQKELDSLIPAHKRTVQRT